jgi:hypothetical protein
MFKTISEIKTFLKNNIGIEYTTICYTFGTPIIGKRKLVVAQNISFAGRILDENHKNYNKLSWCSYPTKNEIIYTEKGFSIRDIELNKIILEYNF